MGNFWLYEIAPDTTKEANISKLKKSNTFSRYDFGELLIKFCKPSHMPNDDFIYWNQQWIQFLMKSEREKIEIDGNLYFDLIQICEQTNREVPEIVELYDYILAVLKLFC